MRILSLHLENFRGITERTVELAPLGVTVLEGDNEVGKTSMVDALDMLFDVQDSSAKAWVKATQPVGRDVATVVEAEVRAGAYRFTYRKQFHKRHSTHLVVHEPAPEQVRGREAHERVLAILGEQVDVPLWKALRLQQGVRLDQADLDAQTSLGQALDASVAEAVGGQREETLVSRVQAEHDLYWTSGGKVREPGLQRSRAVEEARAEVERLSSAVDELDRTVQALDRVRADLARDESAHVAFAEQLRALERQVSDGQQLARTVEALTAAAATTRATRDLTAARLQARAELRDRVAQDVATAEGAVAELDRARQAVADRTRAVAELEDQLAEVTRQLADLRAEAAVLRAEQGRHRDLADLERLSAVVERCDEASRAVREAEAVLAGCPVTEAVLQQVEERHRAWRTACEVARAAAPVLVLTGDGESVETSTGTLVVGNEPQEISLTAGTWLEIGGVRVTGRAGRVQLDADRGEQTARQLLDEACGEAGVRDLEDAVRAHHARRAAVAGLEEARSAAAAAAHGVDVEAARERCAALRTDVVDHSVDDTGRTEDEVTALLADAEARHAVAAEASAVLGSRLAAARELLSAAEADVMRTAVGAETAEARRHAAEGELARLRTERDDDALELVATQAAEAAVVADHAAQDARDRLEESGHARAEQQLAQLREVVREGEARRGRLRDEAARLATVLDERGAAGLVEQLDAARTRLEAVTRDADAWHRRAAAAKVLHEALVGARSRAQLAYVEPLREQVQSLAEVVFGPDVRIDLGPDLRVTQRTLKGSTVAFDQLSTGAREQLAVLGRLACAMLVSGGQGVPVLIDDALGYSDPVRLLAMGRALREAGEACQVVVLTCFPERYRGVTGATTVQLA